MSSHCPLFSDKPQIQRRRYRTRYQERNRKRRRRKNRVFRNRSGGCAGTCRNMFSCMFSGLKVEWDAPEGSCPGLMETCCTSWNSAPKRHKKYIKSGRSLGPFSPQVQVRKDQFFSLFKRFGRTFLAVQLFQFSRSLSISENLILGFLAFSAIQLFQLVNFLADALFVLFQLISCFSYSTFSALFAFQLFQLFIFSRFSAISAFQLL